MKSFIKYSFLFTIMLRVFWLQRDNIWGGAQHIESGIVVGVFHTDVGNTFYQVRKDNGKTERIAEQFVKATKWEEVKECEQQHTTGE